MSDAPHEALRRACSRHTADVVALSGGLDSTIIARLARRRPDSGIAVISRDFVSTDLTYCQLAARALGMELRMQSPDPAELLGGAAETARILGNFNDIEIRNSVVMYVAIKAAAEAGDTSILTGDGADELFAGYDFLLKLEPQELDPELRRLRHIMHFTSQDIGRRFGVRVVSPFLDPEVVASAADIPAEMMVGCHDGRRMGKMVLRRRYINSIPRQIVWRPKSPMQDGAGASGLTGLLEALLTDESFRLRSSEIRDRDGVKIRTKEALFYYQAYRESHDPPEPHPDGCPYCHAHIRKGSKFCRMCGAFPVG